MVILTAAQKHERRLRIAWKKAVYARDVEFLREIQVTFREFFPESREARTDVDTIFDANGRIKRRRGRKHNAG